VALDNVGEFVSAADRIEFGQDEGPREGEIVVPDVPAEFANSSSRTKNDGDGRLRLG
jgi:hypothetical protein